MCSARKAPYASDRTLRRHAAMRTKHYFGTGIKYDEALGSNRVDELAEVLGSKNADCKASVTHK